MKVAGRTALRRAPERCRSIRQQPRSLHAATLSYRLYTRQSPRYGPTARGYVTATATDPARPPAEVAVVGGGITGLTTAYYLGKFLPSTSRVTVYEGEKRVGGWIHTVRRQAPGGGEVVFENGPRMLRGLGGVGFRGDDYVFYDIMHDLGLELKDHAPRKKMLCYHDELYTMPPRLDPAFLYKYLRGKHVLSGAISAGLAFRKHSKNPKRAKLLEDDMSIADFLRTTFGDIQAPWNVLSGMMHGIYGGSIERLSLPSVLPGFWYGMLMPRKLGKDGEFVPRQDLELMEELNPLKTGPDFAENVKKWCTSEVLTFEGGMERLVDAIRKELVKQRVRFITGEPVTGIRYLEKEDKVEITTDPSRSESYAKVISTTTSSALSQMLSAAIPLPKESVSIRTVSLYYPDTALTAKYNGFGYLLPQSTPNPEEALGVFFDSDTYGFQPGEKPGTKLTVLMGGHFWSDRPSDTIPSEEECISRGRAIMGRHLGIARDPDLVHVNLAKGCIPQHVVGHRAMLARTHEALGNGFKGRLAVAGGSYTAVGVMPAIRAGYDVACHVARKAMPHVGDTGLAQFASPLDVLEVERKVLNGLGKQAREPDVVQRFFMGL